MNRRGARRIAAMVVIPIALAACGSSSKKAATSPTTVSSGASATTASAGGAYGYGGASATTTAGTSATTASASGATVHVATVGKLGKVLVSSDGRTLYLFEKDNGTTSACTGQCMGAWPPYTSMNAPTAGPGVTATKLTTATGAAAHQVVYNGHLLYMFSGDKKAGDANGVGIPSWYPVTPQGTSME